MKKDMWIISNSILSIAGDLAIEAVREIETKYEIFENKWGDYVYENVFAKCGSKFNRQVEYVSVVNIAGECMYGMDENNLIYCCSIDMPFSEERFVPESLPSDVSHLVDVEHWGIYKALILRDHSIWEEMKNELITINKNYKKAVNFYKSFMDFVGAVVDQYDTVNEAVAAWPAFKYMLPGWLRDEKFPFDGEPKPLPCGYNVMPFTAFLVRARLMEV